MSFKKLFHVDQDDTVAVPEYHSENFDELQKKADEEENNELKKKMSYTQLQAICSEDP